MLQQAKAVSVFRDTVHIGKNSFRYISPIAYHLLLGGFAANLAQL